MGPYSEWIASKKILAHKLEDGALGASYAEGAIILCAAISTMSSLLWAPQRGQDHKRFCETLKVFCHTEPDLMRISSPLLVYSHPKTNCFLGVSEQPLYYDQSIDKSEAELIGLCSEFDILISSKKIRSYSYLNLLYTQIRCGFSHEYSASVSATDYNFLAEHPFLSHRTQSITSRVSYVNQEFACGHIDKRNRLIYFFLDWISFVATKVALGLDIECEQQDKIPRQNLDLILRRRWWIDGA